MRNGFSFLFGLIALIAGAALAPGAAFATDVGPADGNTYGGSPYRLECHGNANNQSYLYGMTGMIGSWVDRVGGECADWVPNQGWSTAWNARTQTGTVGNSTGGGPQSATCPSGTLVKGFHYTWAVPDRTFMQNITLICVDPLPPFAQHPEAPELKSDNTTDFVTHPGAGASGNFGVDYGTLNTWPVIMCPGDEVAIGMQGGSGDFVDSIGLICGAPPSAPSSASSSGGAGATPPHSEMHLNLAERAKMAGIGTTSASVPCNGAIDGQWQTSEGPMTLAQTNNRLSGTYSKNGGTITATSIANSWIGVWTQTTSGQRCNTARQGSNYWGGLVFEFDHGNCHFDGSYSYCTVNAKGGSPWTGYKIK